MKYLSDGTEKGTGGSTGTGSKIEFILAATAGKTSAARILSREGDIPRCVAGMAGRARSVVRGEIYHGMNRGECRMEIYGAVREARTDKSGEKLAALQTITPIPQASSKNPKGLPVERELPEKRARLAKRLHRVSKPWQDLDLVAIFATIPAQHGLCE